MVRELLVLVLLAPNLSAKKNALEPLQETFIDVKKIRFSKARRCTSVILALERPKSEKWEPEVSLRYRMKPQLEKHPYKLEFWRISGFFRTLLFIS